MGVLKRTNAQAVDEDLDKGVAAYNKSQENESNIKNLTENIPTIIDSQIKDSVNLQSFEIVIPPESWVEGVTTYQNSEIKETDSLLLTLFTEDLSQTYYMTISKAAIACTQQKNGELELTAFGVVPSIEIRIALIRLNINKK